MTNRIASRVAVLDMDLQVFALPNARSSEVRGRAPTSKNARSHERPRILCSAMLGQGKKATDDGLRYSTACYRSGGRCSRVPSIQEYWLHQLNNECPSGLAAIGLCSIEKSRPILSGRLTQSLLECNTAEIKEYSESRNGRVLTCESFALRTDSRG